MRCDVEVAEIIAQGRAMRAAVNALGDVARELAEVVLAEMLRDGDEGAEAEAGPRRE